MNVGLPAAASADAHRRPHHRFDDYLLDEIRDLLLSELRKTLEGQEADREAIERTKRIAEQMRQMQNDQAEEIAAVAKVKVEQS